MGFETSKPVRLFPDNPNKHTYQRGYYWGGTKLSELTMDKRRHSERPLGYTMEWETDRTNRQLIAASLEFFTSMRDKFVVPTDKQSRELAREIRETALKKATQLKRKGWMDAQTVAYLRGNRRRIEPFQTTLFQDVLEEGRSIFYCSDSQEFNPKDLIDKIMDMERFPDLGLTFAKFRSPFGVIEFDGEMGNGVRSISFSTRWRVVRETIEFFNATSPAQATQDEDPIAQVYRNLKNHVRALPLLKRAG